MKAEVHGRNGVRSEIKIRTLKKREILDLPHERVINGKPFTTRLLKGSFHETTIMNPMCDGNVTVKGPVEGMETLSYVRVACDKCEFTAIEDLLRVA